MSHSLGCYGIRIEIENVDAEIRKWQARFVGATSRQKRDISAQIFKLYKKLGGLNKALENCFDIVHVQAVRMSDAGGGRRANISAAQVSQMVDKANEIFKSAKILFRFNSGRLGQDFVDRWNTPMNSLGNQIEDDPNWTMARDFGNRVARDYPKKMVVFFRRGPAGQPNAKKGFSSLDYDFVVMPGYSDSESCGSSPDIVLFAHEAGHYLGLNHTHLQVFNTRDEAEEELRLSGGNELIFDGDNLYDTPPEPYIAELKCGSDTSVTLDGRKFSLLRTNNMSYYYSTTKSHTPQQKDRLKLWVQRRFPNGPPIPITGDEPID